MVQTIGFLITAFIGMTILNRVAEGAFLAASDLTILDSITMLRTVDVLGMFTIPVPNLEFFTSGLPHLIKWDYAFFGGYGSIFQYLLYSVTGAVAFMLFLATIGTISSYFVKIR